MIKSLAKLLGSWRRRGSTAPEPANDLERAACVRAAYLSLLAREPDMEGLTHWIGVLREGGTREKMLRSFTGSAEFKRRLHMAQIMPTTVSRPLDVVEIPSRFAVVGNCQVDPFARCLQAYLGGAIPTRRWVTVDMLVGSEQARAELKATLDSHDFIFMQPLFWDAVAKVYPEAQSKIVLFPSVAFFAFHPDLIYILAHSQGGYLKGPCGDYHSSIALLGWKCGLSVEQTLQLFRRDIYERLGFHDWWNISATVLLEEGQRAGLPLDDAFRDWSRRGCFMHSANHPKLFVIADITRRVLDRLGWERLPGDPTEYALDALGQSVVWPLYPEIGERLGIVGGGHRFKLESPGMLPGGPVRSLDLRDFVEQCHAVYSRHAPEDLYCDRLEAQGFRELMAELKATVAAHPGAIAGVLPAPEVSPLLMNAPPQEPAITEATVPGSAGRFAVLGNCQMGHMARCLQALVGGEMPTREWHTPETLALVQNGQTDLTPVFTAHDYVFLQPWIWEGIAGRYGQYRDKVVLYPSIGFIAYQPDLVPIVIKETGAPLEDGPLQRCHSSLAFLAWQARLSVDQTVALFNRDTFQRLGFLDWWPAAALLLLEEGRKANFPLDGLLSEWARQGCFMYCHVHPRLSVITDIARGLLKRLGIAMRPGNPMQYVNDYLANGVVWPVYPEIAAKLGCLGEYAFKRPSPAYKPDLPVHVLNLREFVEECFAAYAPFDHDALVCQRLDLPQYRALTEELLQGRGVAALPRATRVPIAVTTSLRPPAVSVQSEPALILDTVVPVVRAHPYQNLPPHRFWRSSVQNIEVGQVDPVVKAGFIIQTSTRVATAGSCFAQHISRRLADGGFHFLRTETGENGAVEGDWYSARYGNLYTARQLIQLFNRAYGSFVPVDDAWRMDNGHYADPFRPQIEAGGFGSVEAVDAARIEHLAAVRRMFETLDVFVFTLGLTETWYSKADGAVFPLAPGVAAGAMDEARYGFINFSAAEVAADLETFIQSLHQINPAARLIFTVSPVPLAATYADRHVLVSTTYSKAALRVAVEEIVQRHAHCEYFPSYEIITGSYNRGRYYGEDLRAVTPEGVDHVMRLFFQHYTGAVPVLSAEEERLAEARRGMRIVCDEELLAVAAGN